MCTQFVSAARIRLTKHYLRFLPLEHDNGFNAWSRPFRRAAIQTAVATVKEGGKLFYSQLLIWTGPIRFSDL